MDDKEPFVSRWSRRKLEAKEDALAGVAQAAESPAAAAAAPLPSVRQQPAAGTVADISPEYREFFDPKVDEKLRRTALKKLFSDPHFNVMDGLDTYIDDYSKPDPIPAAMLRQLNQAKDLLLFDEEKKSDAGAGAETGAAREQVAASPAVPAEVSALADAAAAGVAGADVAPATPCVTAAGPRGE